MATQSFGNISYGLLSPETLAGMVYKPTSGVYGQQMTSPAPALKPGDTFDPYYNLRNIPGLLNNPNFSWLSGFNAAPMTGLTVPERINTAKYGSTGVGGEKDTKVDFQITPEAETKLQTSDTPTLSQTLTNLEKAQSQLPADQQVTHQPLIDYVTNELGSRTDYAPAPPPSEWSVSTNNGHNAQSFGMSPDAVAQFNAMDDATLLDVRDNLLTAQQGTPAYLQSGLQPQIDYVNELIAYRAKKPAPTTQTAPTPVQAQPQEIIRSPLEIDPLAALGNVDLSGLDFSNMGAGLIGPTTQTAPAPVQAQSQHQIGDVSDDGMYIWTGYGWNLIPGV